MGVNLKKINVWVEELGWQTFLGYLEHSLVMSDVDIVEGTNQSYVCLIVIPSLNL